MIAKSGDSLRRGEHGISAVPVANPDIPQGAEMRPVFMPKGGTADAAEKTSCRFCIGYFFCHRLPDLPELWSIGFRLFTKQVYFHRKLCCYLISRVFM